MRPVVDPRIRGGPSGDIRGANRPDRRRRTRPPRYRGDGQPPTGEDSGQPPRAEDGGRTVAPNREDSRLDRGQRRSNRKLAKEVAEQHSERLRARYQRDLLSEKLLLHIDGAADWQWADILHGSRVEIPRYVSEFRKTENLLRPIVDRAVSHHTTMDLRYFADSTPDRRAKERAKMDTLWLNNLQETQNFLDLFADAMYMAMPAGFCPVHAYWREDALEDWYEPVEPGQVKDPFSGRMPDQGMIDCFVGNPFDTAFNYGATRGNIRQCSYGRMIPADMVRQEFGHIPEIRKMQGTTTLPSAAEFQRIARTWRSSGLGVHGEPLMTEYKKFQNEMFYVICEETAPGVLSPDDPGRLRIAVVPGDVDYRRGRGSIEKAELATDQPLPGGDFSFSIFYSHHRGSDVHGKPWVEDLDQLQVDLNIALSKRWEVINRMVEAPIVAPGGALDNDMMDIGGYNLLEVQPSLAGWRPRVMEWPQGVVGALDNEINERRQAMYTIGGYQAVSRGESPGSRTAYRAILALQQADNTVHGPVNQRFRKSAIRFADVCWKQMKAYGDVPWFMQITGDEYEYLAEPYIDATKLSDRPPNFKLVNAFGASPELRAQEVLELMQTRGADGQPFLSTREAQKQYPNQMIFDNAGDPEAVQKRRARTVATKIETYAREYREKTGLEAEGAWRPEVQQAAQWVFQKIESDYPRLRDDDLKAHLDALTELTQDETADSIARFAAMQRQALYYQWQADMAALGTQAPGAMAPGGDPMAPAPGGNGAGSAGGNGAGGGSRGDLDRRETVAEFESGGEREAEPLERAEGPTIANTAR